MLYSASTFELHDAGIIVLKNNAHLIDKIDDSVHVCVRVYVYVCVCVCVCVCEMHNYKALLIHGY